jgi:hypothetical protein
VKSSAVQTREGARLVRFTPIADEPSGAKMTLSGRGLSAQGATQHRAEQRVHCTSVQGRFAQAQDCGFETICARAAAASATSRSARVPGSPTAVDPPLATIWGNMLR